MIYYIQKRGGDPHKRRKVTTMTEELTLALALILDHIEEFTDSELEQLADAVIGEQTVRNFDCDDVDESGFNPYAGAYDFDC